MSDLRYSEGFLLGLATASTTLLVLLIFIDTRFQLDFNKWTPNFLTVLVALWAAYFAIFGIRKQVQSNHDLEDSRRVSKLQAARATLPLALSEMHEVSENRMRFLVDQDLSRQKASWLISPETQTTVKECIELSTGSPQEVLKEITIIYQILTSRSKSWSHSRPFIDEALSELERFERVNAILQWASFQAICDSVFDYARSRSEVVNRSNVSNSAKSIVEWLSFNGWVLENDAVFCSILAGYAPSYNFAFNDVNWINCN